MPETDLVRCPNKTDLINRQLISYITLANCQMNQENQVPVQEQRNAPRHEGVVQAETRTIESNVAADATTPVEVRPQGLVEHDEAHVRLPPAVQLVEQPGGKEEEITQGDEFGRFQPSYEGQAQFQGTMNPHPRQPDLITRYHDQGSQTQVRTGNQLNAPTAQN